MDKYKYVVEVQMMAKDGSSALRELLNSPNVYDVRIIRSEKLDIQESDLRELKSKVAKRV